MAYELFFGADSGTGAQVLDPLEAFVAYDAFMAGLTGVGEADFEALPPGTTAPLAVEFPGSSGTITATVAGTGAVVEHEPFATDGDGRFSVLGGVRFWLATAPAGVEENFAVGFSQSVAAFGFWGTDPGDFGGTLVVDLLDASNAVMQSFDIDVPGALGVGGSADGAVFFWGLKTTVAGELFRRVRIRITGTVTADLFGFDSFTVGDLSQAGGGGGGGEPPVVDPPFWPGMAHVWPAGIPQ